MNFGYSAESKTLCLKLNNLETIRPNTINRRKQGL